VLWLAVAAYQMEKKSNHLSDAKLYFDTSIPFREKMENQVAEET
jgi:hypothetical protein